MYAISISPPVAYFLTTGHFKHACWWHNTTRWGDIYLGVIHTCNHEYIKKVLQTYTDCYEADRTLPEPLTWYTTFPQGALVAKATLAAPVPFTEAPLSDFERRFLPRNRWVYTFENIQMLDAPIFCRQYTGYIWEYDEVVAGPKRYRWLTQEQIDQYYDLCLSMERCRNDRATCQALEETHPANFIFNKRYYRLRAGIMRRYRGVMRINRKHWRRQFAKTFSAEYRVKPS